MKRRQVVVAGAATIGGSARLWAQPNSGKIWRIGILSESWPRDPLTTYFMTSAGYVEGRDFVIDFKHAEGRRERLPTLAMELVAAKPDVIVGFLNPEIIALKRATNTIPIVMMYASAPVELGIVDSLARPGGNITGTTTNHPESAGKMMQILRDSVPGIKRLFWLTDLSYPGISVYHKIIEEAAVALGLNIQLKDARTREEMDALLVAMERDRPDGIAVAMVGVVGERYQRIIDVAARLRIPALYSIRQPVVDGGLMSYTANFATMAQRNGWMIDRIFKGTKPSDIPVEEPAKYLLSINMKTARALGLTIPQKVLLSANELIE
jgi:putative ABC transport system substrate-binding protein